MWAVDRASCSQAWPYRCGQSRHRLRGREQTSIGEETGSPRKINGMTLDANAPKVDLQITLLCFFIPSFLQSAETAEIKSCALRTQTPTRQYSNQLSIAPIKTDQESLVCLKKKKKKRKERKHGDETQLRSLPCASWSRLPAIVTVIIAMSQMAQRANVGDSSGDLSVPSSPL